MKTHEWHHIEEGETTFFRANHFAKKWTYFSRKEEDEEWVKHDPMKQEDWENLREVLWRKYQRNRCSWKIIARIDQYLEDEFGQKKDV